MPPELDKQAIQLGPHRAIAFEIKFATRLSPGCSRPTRPPVSQNLKSTSLATARLAHA